MCISKTAGKDREAAVEVADCLRAVAQPGPEGDFYAYTQE